MKRAQMDTGAAYVKIHAQVVAWRARKNQFVNHRLMVRFCTMFVPNVLMVNISVILTRQGPVSSTVQVGVSTARRPLIVKNVYQDIIMTIITCVLSARTLALPVLQTASVQPVKLDIMD